jgi:UDP-N-acetylbacillosamine transaminase
MKRIFLSPPDMSGKELELIHKVFESNYIAPLGEYVNKFEDSVKNLTKSEFALALNSGTSAIHLALRVLGVKQGDFVLASTFTFIGSVAPILYQNATPIFIDADKSWNLSPELLEKFLNNWKGKTPKAIIVTHLYGQMANMKKIIEICKKWNIAVIEDAAESLGATLDGQESGTFGDFGIFSFNGNKILTTSGGGMLIGKDGNLIEKAKFLSTQAKEDFPYYEHIEVGYNYRMSNVLASIGVAQMSVLDDRVEKRRKVFSWYKEILGDFVNFMPEIENSLGNRWLTTFTFKKDINLDEVLAEFSKNQIEVRHLWKPMHIQPIFENAIGEIDGTSEELFKNGLCLPSGSDMKREDVERVSKIILDFLS